MKNWRVSATLFRMTCGRPCGMSIYSISWRNDLAPLWTLPPNGISTASRREPKRWPYWSTNHRIWRVGRHALRLESCKLNLSVAEMIAMLWPDIEGRRAEWRIADLHTVECDPALLKQVFQTYSLMRSSSSDHAPWLQLK